MKQTNRYSSKSRWKKWGHLSSYQVDYMLTVWTKHLRASERSHLALFRKYYGLLDFEPPLARYQPLKLQSFVTFFADSAVFWYFHPQYFMNGNSTTYYLYYFLKELKKNFQVLFNVLPLNVWYITCSVPNLIPICPRF